MIPKLLQKGSSLRHEIPTDLYDRAWTNILHVQIGSDQSFIYLNFARKDSDFISSFYMFQKGFQILCPFKYSGILSGKNFEQKKHIMYF